MGQDHARGDPERQAQAAQPGDRPLVDPPELVGPVDRPGPGRDPGDQRRRQHAAHEGQREDQQVAVGDHHESGSSPCPGQPARAFLV